MHSREMISALLPSLPIRTYAEAPTTMTTLERANISEGKATDLLEDATLTGT
jgi:hypothetical protein